MSVCVSKCQLPSDSIIQWLSHPVTQSPVILPSFQLPKNLWSLPYHSISKPPNFHLEWICILMFVKLQLFHFSWINETVLNRFWNGRPSICTRFLINFAQKWIKIMLKKWFMHAWFCSCSKPLKEFSAWARLGNLHTCQLLVILLSV